MRPRLLITGSGGFIGSYLTPKLEEEGYEIIKVKFEDEKLNFSTGLRNNETLIVLNLAAATKGSSNFTVGYRMSIKMPRELFDALKEHNVNIDKFIHFSSFGELNYSLNNFNVIFTKQFKPISKACDDYQFWKIKQRDLILKLFNNAVTNIVIPYINDSNKYDVYYKFNNMRIGRKILVTRLIDIFDSVKQVINDKNSSPIIIPEFRRQKVKGSPKMIISFLVHYFASYLSSDHSNRGRLIYSMSSQSIKT